tara:strand:+ start:1859 stop:2230 length:372 start_codon:yes stop_codon:yes gene_type:complete
MFISINSEIGLIKKISSNFIYSFGFRESVAISRSVFIPGNLISQISLVISLALIAVHSIGLYGVIKFSIRTNISLLIIFSYLIAPLLAIAHMRYLLPLMPVLLFGFTYLFFSKEKLKKLVNTN